MVNIKELLSFRDDPNTRIGLLGGSFNPAHSGHLHISEEAIRLLNLDYVLWLVSPQNPLKSLDIRDSLSQRVCYAKLLVKNSKIIVSDIEKNLPTNYTADTIKILKETYPKIKFVWLMGADNMVEVHRWYNWHNIFQDVFVAVFDRAEFKNAVIASEASQCYSQLDISMEDFKKYSLEPGAWYFFQIQKSSMSSTNLRNVYKAGNIDIMKPTDIEQLKDIVLTSLDNDKGSEILLCDLKGKSDLARYMVIVSGSSSRHVCSMIENLMDILKKVSISSTASGLENGQWVLLDAGDIIINAFLPEYRELYKLEELWG